MSGSQDFLCSQNDEYNSGPRVSLIRPKLLMATGGTGARSELYCATDERTGWQCPSAARLKRQRFLLPACEKSDGRIAKKIGPVLSACSGFGWRMSGCGSYIAGSVCYSISPAPQRATPPLPARGSRERTIPRTSELSMSICIPTYMLTSGLIP
jgi:hypothetical protein